MNETQVHGIKANDLEKLVTLQMPYGKYAGRFIADLPGNYLHWFARQGFPKASWVGCWR